MKRETVSIKLLYGRRQDSIGRKSVEIYAYFRIEQKRSCILIDFVYDNEWDKTTNQPKNPDIRKYVHSRILEVMDYEHKLLNDGKRLTPQLFSMILSSRLSKSRESVLEWVKDINKNGELELSTETDFIQTAKVLEKFFPGLRFRDINKSFVREFNGYLKSRGYKQTTIAKHHKNLKSFYKKAQEGGLVSSRENPYEGFRVDQGTVDRVPLTEEELYKLWDLRNVYEVGSRIWTSHQMFMLACFTALRYSDVVSLKYKHISFDKNGILLHKDRMIKVNRPVILPLYDLFGGLPEEIVKKGIEMNYKGYADDKILKTISNPEVNKHLKMMAEDVGMKKNLHFHLARHTCLTLIAAKTGSEYAVMKVGAIQKADTARRYVNMSGISFDFLKEIHW